MRSGARFVVAAVACMGSACVVPIAPSAPDGEAVVTPRADGDEPASSESQRVETPRSRAALPPGPLDLLALQKLALQRNPSVEEWRARVAAAEASRRAAIGSFFPALSAEAQYLRLEDTIASDIPMFGRVVFQDDESITVRSQLRYTLHDWGRRNDTYQAASHEEEGERASRERALQEVAQAVAVAYLGLLESREDAVVLQKSVEALEAALELAENRLAAGRATRADVLVFRARVERRRFELREASDLALDLEDRLRRLLDAPEAGELRLVEPGVASDDVPPLELLESLALARRSEIRALRRREEALAERAAALEKTYLPEVYFFLQHEYADPATALSEDSLLSGGFGASWDIFDGGTRYHEARALTSRAAELRASLRGIGATIVEEVRRAHRRLLRSFEALEVARSVVAQAEENLRQVRALFDQGKATGQEVLEAESLLTAERARSARAVYEQHRALATLRFALGLNVDEEIESP